MAELQWGDPPPRFDRRYWTPVAEALRSRPREWAMVAQNTSPTIANNIKRGIYPDFHPPGAFEATSRRRAEYAGQKADIWARYVGDAS